MTTSFAYVSAADDGRIDIFAVDPATAALKPVGTAAAGPTVMPLAVSPDRRHLYAAIRSEPFRVATFRIDPATGHLEPIVTAPLTASMCSIATDATGRVLLAASYGGSCVSISPIDGDGAVREAPAKVLSTGRHAHDVVADRGNRFVYATSLGDDRVEILDLALAPVGLARAACGVFEATPGDGPRHMVISTDNRFLYVLCELSGHILSLQRNEATGALREVGRVPTVATEAGLSPGRISAPMTSGGPGSPAEARRIWAADLQIAPDGGTLYASERTTSTLSWFRVERASGLLTFAGRTETERQPRGFAIDASGRTLIASGEKSDHVASYAIDPSSGDLRLAGRAPVGRGANWVEIVTVGPSDAR